MLYSGFLNRGLKAGLGTETTSFAVTTSPTTVSSATAT